MINWQDINTVLLDMDGTLLDLHFDNHFWQHYLPTCYGKANDLSIRASKQVLFAQFAQQAHKLNWYCVDFWSQQLGLDIVSLKRDVKDKIRFRPDTVAFLTALKDKQIPRTLVTNAHPKALDLKLEHTGLGGYLDHIFSSHQFGAPKESPDFWQRFQAQYRFDPAKTLLIDDSVSVLNAAKDYGIGHLVAIANPDSQLGSIPIQGFPAIHDFKEILPSE
ncbi:MAG: HAD family hydrolase [Gammaproteobacteria bacterium]|nr:MAG: HAD family hydrolase [Gammaproteobacteria bacterium]